VTREKISKDVRLSRTGSAKTRGSVTSTDTRVKKNTKKKNKERIIKNPSLQPRKIVEAKPSTSLSSPGKVGYFEEIPNWKMGVIEHFCKDDADKLIKHDSNYFNEPSPGKDYVVVRVQCERIGGKDEFLDVSNYNFTLVGDKRILYRSEYSGPEPQLNSTLLVGGSTEGWITFEVFEDDRNFVVIFEDSRSWNDSHKIYISLD